MPRRPRIVTFFTLADIVHQWKDGRYDSIHHDCIESGHWGINKTHAIISCCFDLPNMLTQIKLHVQACESCQRTKSERHKRRGLLQPLSILFENGKVSLSIGHHCHIVTDFLVAFIHRPSLKNDSPLRMNTLRKKHCIFAKLYVIIVSRNLSSLIATHESP